MTPERKRGRLLPIPVYVERWVAGQFRPHQVERVTDEFLQVLSDDAGGSTYTREVAPRLLRARSRGRLPESLDYFGR